MMSLTLSSRPRETCCYPTTHYLIFYFSAIFLDQHTQKTHPSKMFKSRMERKWMVLLSQNLQWVKIVWLKSNRIIIWMTVLLSGQFTASYIQLLKKEPYLIFVFRNYNPETPIDDMKKDPSFDLKKEQRRTRVVPKRSLDHTANTTTTDDTVSFFCR